MDSSPPEGDILLFIFQYFSGIVVYPITSDIFSALLFLGLLLIASALVSGSEVAFFSLTQTHIEELKKNLSARNKKILFYLDHPQKLLANILIANNFINVAIVILSYFIISKIFDFGTAPVIGFIFEVVVVTFLILIFGEILPKIYATHNTVRITKFMIYPIMVMEKIFFPFSFFLIRMTAVLEKKFKGFKKHSASMEDIDHAIDLAVVGKTSKEEIKLLKGVVKFGNISVKQVMKDRLDIVAIEYNSNFTELLSKVKEAGYSRLPVYKDTLDTIAGVLYVKDLIPHASKEKEFYWQQFIRSTFFVPEAKKLNILLKDFQTKRMHLAIVVDEYGGTSGMVTLEDIMEEIIGEIKDEFDTHEEIEYKMIEPNLFEFEGKTLLNDICRVMNIAHDSFDDIKGESDSLAGLLLEIAGHIPKTNQEIRFKNFIFTPISVGKKRIKQVRIKHIVKENEKNNKE